MHDIRTLYNIFVKLMGNLKLNLIHIVQCLHHLFVPSATNLSSHLLKISRWKVTWKKIIERKHYLMNVKEI